MSPCWPSVGLIALAPTPHTWAGCLWLCWSQGITLLSPTEVQKRRQHMTNRSSQALGSSPVCIDCLHYLFPTVKNPIFLSRPELTSSTVISILRNVSALMYSASSSATDCVFRRGPHQYIYPSYVLFLQKLSDLPPPEKWSLCALLMNLDLVPAPSNGAQPE